MAPKAMKTVAPKAMKTVKAMKAMKDMPPMQPKLVTWTKKYSTVQAKEHYTWNLISVTHDKKLRVVTEVREGEAVESEEAMKAMKAMKTKE
jgi:hypothetical protein